MSEVINADSAVPTGQVAPEGASTPDEPLVPTDAKGVDPEILALLADTQNSCLQELGYSPNLLLELHDLQKQCATLQQRRAELEHQCNLLRADNTKLYSDNRALAVFVQQQDQRMKFMQDPTDHQRSMMQLHERVRALITERDQLSGKLHSALNEVVLLRQELARFLPNALASSSRERMPSGGVPIPPPTAQRSMSQPAFHPYTQAVHYGHAPANGVHHPSPLLLKQQILPATRPIAPKPLPPPQHRNSIPAIAPLNIAALPPPISQHRRPSAPAQLITGQPGLIHSPASASPLNNFSGLNLSGSNPPTPSVSRPGTANGQVPDFPRSGSNSRPPSSRGLHSHMHPPIPHHSSSSSLAGAFIDLTGEESLEGSARKKRKLDHSTPPMAGHSGQIPAPTSINPPPSPPAASGNHFGNDGHMSPTQAHMPPRQEMPPVSDPPSQPPIIATPVPSTTIPQPEVPSPAQPEQMPAADYPAQDTRQPPAADPVLTQRLPEAHPVQDTQLLPPADLSQDIVMDEEVSEEEPETTVEEDCLEVNFEEDEADETKLWCRMCRSRFELGYYAEAPTPFVNAPQQVLLEHCEQAHPDGWKVLMKTVVEQRAAEAAEA